MNITSKLALTQLRMNIRRSLLTILGIILSVAMITAVCGFVESTKDMLKTTVLVKKGNWHMSIAEVSDAEMELLKGEPLIYGVTTGEALGMQFVYFRFEKLTKNYQKVGLDIAQRYGLEKHILQFNTELIALEGVIARDRVTVTLYSLAAILIAIIVIGSVIVIANAFYVSSSERILQFGILKSVGATKEQIQWSVLAEAFFLALAAIPIGLLAGVFVQWFALSIANVLLKEINELNNGWLTMRVVLSPLAIVVAVCTSLLTILLSAWFPALKVSKISSIEAIRLSGEIKLTEKNVRASRLAEGLFGFEGALASKFLKRNSTKYRATVITLVVSMVLLVAVSTFVGLLVTAAGKMYAVTNENVLIRLANENDGLKKEAMEAVYGLSGASKRTISLLSFEGEISDAYLTAEYKAFLEQFNMYSGGNDTVKVKVVLHSISDEEYNVIAQSIGGQPSSILINKTGLIEIGSKYTIFEPLNFSGGMSISYKDGNGEALSLDASLTEIPSELVDVDAICVNLLVSQGVFHAIATELGANIEYYIFANAENPDEFSKACIDLLKIRFDNEKAYFVVNYEQIERYNKSIRLVMQIFFYGFIAMLSLIGVTNVVSTISGSMALRATEFAMLSSVGMTREGLKKMLSYESLLFGIKAISIGLPISFLVSWVINTALGFSFEFGFYIPWHSIVISIAAIFALTFATMRFSVARFERVSIVEALKL